MSRSMQLLVMLGLILFADGGGTLAWGQLFGQRTTGQPLQSRRNRSPANEVEPEAVGTLTGEERFLRENRSRDAFVGSDRQSTRGFIGSQQALGSGRVRTAVEGLRQMTDDSARINRPLPPLREGQMYYPNLVLGNGFSELPAPADPRVAPRPVPDTELAQRLQKHVNGEIQILRQGELAVLEGTVASAEEAERLRLLVSFEPRIYRIENRLRVAR